MSVKSTKVYVNTQKVNSMLKRKSPYYAGGFKRGILDKNLALANVFRV